MNQRKHRKFSKMMIENRFVVEVGQYRPWLRRKWQQVAMVFVLFCTVQVSWSSQAWGQLFGARSVGNPISSRSAGLNSASQSVGPAVGMLDGSERFVRGNRSRADFVGSDRSERAGFVGSGQAIGVGRVRSATEGLRIETSDSARLNRPLPPQSRRGLYYPRLEVAFDVDMGGSPAERSPEGAVAATRLQERIAAVVGQEAQLTMQGRTAILSGTVASARSAELAEQLLKFEPGIDRVQNNLQVAGEVEVVPLPQS